MKPTDTITVTKTTPEKLETVSLTFEEVKQIKRFVEREGGDVPRLIKMLVDIKEINDWRDRDEFKNINMRFNDLFQRCKSFKLQLEAKKDRVSWWQKVKEFFGNINWECQFCILFIIVNILLVTFLVGTIR